MLYSINEYNTVRIRNKIIYCFFKNLTIGHEQMLNLRVSKHCFADPCRSADPRLKTAVLGEIMTVDCVCIINVLYINGL